MAFLSDAERIMSRVASDNSTVGPGSYSPTIHKKQSYNFSDIPFLSTDRRNVFGNNLSYIDQVREIQTIQKNEKGVRQAGGPISSKNQVSNHLGTAPFKEKINNTSPDNNILETTPGPGMYYIDPIQKVVEKIREGEIAKQLFKLNKRKHQNRINSLARTTSDRSPSIPKKYRNLSLFSVGNCNNYIKAMMILWRSAKGL